MRDALLASMYAFTAGEPLSDDIALIVLAREELLPNPQNP